MAFSKSVVQLLVLGFYVALASGASPLFAPYFDLTLKDGPNLTYIAQQSNQKTFTLAFALGSFLGCEPMWGGQVAIDDAEILAPIKALQAQGGEFVIATGGAMGPYLEHLCGTVDDLANAYKKVLDVVGTTHLDIDVEAPINNDVVNQALAKVQRERPDTTVSYTLMIQGEDYGLTPSLGVDVLKSAVANGVNIDIVNAMTMEFGGTSSTWGETVIGAAESTLKQMKDIFPGKSDAQLKKMLGVTPMIGRNYNGRVLETSDARRVVQWANDNHIGLLAFWSSGRDNPCPGQGVSPYCSSTTQETFEFTRIFQEFRG